MKSQKFARFFLSLDFSVFSEPFFVATILTEMDEAKKREWEIKITAFFIIAHAHAMLLSVSFPCSTLKLGFLFTFNIFLLCSLQCHSRSRPFSNCAASAFVMHGHCKWFRGKEKEKTPSRLNVCENCIEKGKNGRQFFNVGLKNWSMKCGEMKLPTTICFVISNEERWYGGMCGER